MTKFVLLNSYSSMKKNQKDANDFCIAIKQSWNRLFNRDFEQCNGTVNATINDSSSNLVIKITNRFTK